MMVTVNVIAMEIPSVIGRLLLILTRPKTPTNPVLVAIEIVHCPSVNVTATRTATVAKIYWTTTTATVIDMDHSRNATATETWSIATVFPTAENAMI